MNSPLRQQYPEIWQTPVLVTWSICWKISGSNLAPSSASTRRWGQLICSAASSWSVWQSDNLTIWQSDNQTRARRTSKNVDEQPTIGSVYGGGGVNLKRAHFSHQGKEIHRRNLQAWVPRELPTSGARRDDKTLFNFKLRPNIAWYWLVDCPTIWSLWYPDDLRNIVQQCCMIMVHPEVLCRPLSRSTSAVSLLSKRWLKPAIPHRGESHIRSAWCISNSHSCLENEHVRIDITWRWRSLEVVTLWIELPLCWCTPSQFCILYLFFHLPNFVFQIFYFPFHLFTLAS